MTTTPVSSESVSIILAVADELERLARYDIDPTDVLPDWLLVSLPEPDGREYLSHARYRWEPIVRSLRSCGATEAQ
jgi:hypothetical protein